MKPEKVDKYCSSMDILPTLSNLMGLEYDSRLLMGRDIFSDSKPMVIFNSRNWITDKARYTALKNEAVPNGSGSAGSKLRMSQKYVDSINRIVSDEFDISRLVLDKDYYRIVLPQ